MTDELLALPKVELHVHLEGTIRADTAIELARRHGHEPADVLPLEDGGYPHRFRDFDHFVELYLAVSRQVRTPEDLELVAAAFVRQQAEQGVRYSEATFTASTHVNQGMDPDAMWAALRAGFATEPSTRVGLIVDAVRNLGPRSGHQTVELVERADAPIVALGLAGIEGSAPASDFAMLRDAADRLGLGVVVHAGETGAPSEVVDALDVLGANRIGHGIASAKDPAVLDRVVRDQVVLEVCPSSNVVIGVVESLEAHPLPRLLEAGVAVTVNSDDPPFFATTLTDELRHARRLAGLGPGELADLQRRAAAASFLPVPDVQAIVGEVDAWEAAQRA